MRTHNAGLVRAGDYTSVASGTYVGQVTFCGLGHSVLTVAGQAPYLPSQFHRRVERGIGTARRFPLLAEHACSVPVNALSSPRWRVSDVFPDLISPGDDVGCGRDRRRRDHVFQFSTHFGPPGSALTRTGPLVIARW